MSFEDLKIVIMINGAVWLVVACLLVGVFSKPYQTPMMGEAGGSRTLVVLNDMSLVQSHSLFFGGLKRMGHELTYKDPAGVVLTKYGESVYDNIVVFASDIEDTSDDLLEFMNKGGNILVATDENIAKSLRDFAENCGVEFDSAGSHVVDHFSYSAAEDKDKIHSAIITDNVFGASNLLSSYSDVPSASRKVLYQGIGHAVDENNIFAVRVLRGNPTTYSADPSKSVGDYPETAGADTLLVTAMQGRNNARITFAGSVNLFSNEFFRSHSSADGGNGNGNGNEQFCDDVASWTFGQMGVLRFRDVTHHLSDGTPPDVILHEKHRPNDLPSSLFPDPEITRNSLVYRIKDELVFSMVVEEYQRGAWVPFQADDMQLEFVMLDPHVRTTMVSDPDTGKFVATFIAPDNYGIFKFRVLYRRPGYSIIHAEVPVSVRPFKHNEYDRYLFTAFPYYTSSFSAMIAFFVFSFFYLFSKDKE